MRRFRSVEEVRDHIREQVEQLKEEVFNTQDWDSFCKVRGMYMLATKLVQDLTPPKSEESE